MSSAYPLIAEAISKSYGRTRVLESVDLTLEPGEITALIGGSGAGKSTLLRLFAGFEPLDQGKIRYGETVLSARGKLVPPKDRRTGLIFQDFALFPHLNVLQNIMYGLQSHSKSDRQTIASDWVAQLHLQHRQNAFPHQLSGGEQQRVAIARALAPRPLAILMDEPFSGLDPALRAETRDMVLSVVLASNIPTLLVTHDPSEALRHADKIAVMAGGKILQTGTAESVYKTPSSLGVACALGSIQSYPVEALPSEWTTDFGSEDELHWRPEALRLDPTGTVEATVLSIGGVGPAAEVKVLVEETSFLLRNIVDLPKPGDKVKLSLDRHAVLTFSADKT
ncbi:MAG: ABC transporter ATP-binding protein [Pseudomonadota bacterium]